MTLGMIWTIILRFAIQDISVEGNIFDRMLIKQCMNHCIFSNRNVGQGRFTAMVSTKNSTIQKCERSKFSHEVN